MLPETGAANGLAPPPSARTTSFKGPECGRNGEDLVRKTHLVALEIPPTTPTVVLPRIRLRPFAESDIAARQQLGVDPEIQRSFGGTPDIEAWQPMTEEAARTWYEHQRSQPGPFVWALEHRGRLIGSCRLHALNHADERARYAIGILDDNLLGCGLGTEVTKGVLELAFNDVGLHRIDLRVLASNRRAVACYEKCGFAIEGREREAAKIDGQRYDDLIMGILRHEHQPDPSARDAQDAR